MMSIAKAACITLIVFLMDIISNTKKDLYKYVVLFLIIAGIAFSFSSLEALEDINFHTKLKSNSSNFQQFNNYKEYEMDANVQIGILKMGLSCQAALTFDQMVHFTKLINQHREEGTNKWTEARNKCAWLPNLNDRQKAEGCFLTALSALSSGSPASKIITMTITLLTQYGLACINEWHEINTLLNQAQYHYEMMEFYQNVLANG